MRTSTVTGAAPLTAIVSGTMLQRLLRAAKLGARARSDRGARDRDPATSAATLVSPQAMKRLRPIATAGVPGSVAPMTSKSPADRCARYQSDGICAPRCGSLASSGLPLAVIVPSTTQLFDPSASPVPRQKASDANGLDARLTSSASRRRGRRLLMPASQAASRGRNARLPCASATACRVRVRMLRPSAGYGGISSAVRSAPTRCEQVVPQQLERVVRAEVPRHHLDPHEHVGAGPRLGLEAQQRELRRQPAAVMRRDERVDAGDVGVDLAPCVWPAARPRPLAPRGRSRPSEEIDPAAASPRRRSSDSRPWPMRRWNSICHRRSCACT